MLSHSPMDHSGFFSQFTCGSHSHREKSNSHHLPFTLSIIDYSFPKLFRPSSFTPFPSLRLYNTFVIQTFSFTVCSPSWDSPQPLKYSLKFSYINVYPLSCKFYEFCQMHNIMHLPLQYHTKQFSCPINSFIHPFSFP